MKFFKMHTDEGCAITVGFNDADVVTKFMRKHDGALILVLKDGDERHAPRDDRQSLIEYLDALVLGSRVEPNTWYVAKHGQQKCWFEKCNVLYTE